MLTFQILKNTSPYKKMKAKSIEEAKGMLREMMKFHKTEGDYFELKSPEGKLIPVFSAY